MLGITKDGRDCDGRSIDVATCGLARNCCAYIGRAETRSARTATVRNMIVDGKGEDGLTGAGRNVKRYDTISKFR